jgi:hypothetical protein
MAICERTPDSMWSMRCEMGWPMAIAAGRLIRRARMSAEISPIERVISEAGFRPTSSSLT